MKGKKILVCDDDKGISEMLQMLLDDEGFTVSVEISSVNLLKRMENEKPDLLLLDIWMPVLSGDQILKRMKASASFSQIPVLMYSASTEGQKIADASGADGFIAKPFDLDELLEMIEKMV
ncbi:response regulator [Pedobacter sp. Du54]|uniref:response regulator n=1 Tax=Pedobacter anseongensis TaxID=3133439 RepID=UPI0030AC0170